MQYRKKPIVIEATQWFKDGDHPAVKVWDKGGHVYKNGMPLIKTLEGELTVTPGDWIITGIKGEHYPCKPDIFAATYEPAEQSPSLPCGESIDTLEFSALIGKLVGASEELDDGSAYSDARIDLVAFIDAKLTEARRDAERYRHIRDSANNGYDLRGPAGIDKWHVSRKVREGEGEYLWGGYLDAAIDRSIAAAPAPDKGDTHE